MSLMPGLAPALNGHVWDYSDFGFREHLSVLHPANSRSADAKRRGVIAFGRLDKRAPNGWSEWTARIGDDAVNSAERALRQDGGRDLYVSQQAFDGRRAIANLTALGACFVDLDYYKHERWAGYGSERVAMAALQHLEDLKLPFPSYVLSTGRGLACVWLLELVPFRALPRWTAVQKALYTALKDFEADRRALDAARVLRLTDSRHGNATTDPIVRMLWCQGKPTQPVRYEFASLADEVLPLTQDELKQVRETRKPKEPFDRPERKPTQKLTGATFWATASQHLQKLRRFRDPEHGKLPPGERDAWIFLAANALSWMNIPDAFQAQIWHVAMQATPWTDQDLNASIHAVVRRARLAAQGETMEFNGRQVDSRYRFKSSTMVEWLQITPAEQKGANLRVLIDETRRKECDAERAMKSRQKHGCVSRLDQQSRRIEIGLEAIRLQKETTMNREALAQHFGQSTGYISQSIRDARKHGKV